AVRSRIALPARFRRRHLPCDMANQVPATRPPATVGASARRTQRPTLAATAGPFDSPPPPQGGRVGVGGRLAHPPPRPSPTRGEGGRRPDNRTALAAAAFPFPTRARRWWNPPTHPPHRAAI